MAKYRFDPEETHENMRMNRVGKRYKDHKLARSVGRENRSKRAMQFEEIPLKYHRRIN